MTREEIEQDAKNFAWAHEYIAVNANTGVPHTEETPCPVSKMRMNDEQVEAYRQLVEVINKLKAL